MEYSSLIRPEFADGSHLHHERAMAKKELVICAATLSSILRNQPHQPKRNSTVLIRVADARGCSLKKILVHSPKKSEKPEENPKNPRKILGKSEENPKNPPKITKKTRKIQKRPKNPQKRFFRI
jgi:hypothetical protein